jgi:hypothetical protein
MAKAIVRQTSSGIWVQPNGPFTNAVPFERGYAGTGDISLPVAGDRTPFFATDAFGNAVPLGAERSAPGALANTTIENYLGFYRDFMEKMADQNLSRNIQIRFHNCISLDNPAGWTKVLHLGDVESGDITLSAPVSRDYADARIGKSAPVNAIYWVMMVRQALSRLATTEANDLTNVIFLDDLESGCGNGYLGPDKIGFITAAAGSGATANVLYTIDGGGTWAVTSADPFAADEDVDFPQVFFMTKSTFRLMVGCTTTAAGAPAKIAYADVTLGAEGTTTWTNVSVGSTNGEVVQALHFHSFARIYAAVSGDIYLSEDQGLTWTRLYSGSTAISKIISAPNGNVYAVGATGTILVEKGETGTFSALVAPGSSAITSIAAANDGTLWIGYATTLAYSRNSLPGAVGSWTTAKTFPANHAVVEISLKGGEKALGGDSQLIQLVVNDSVTPNGEVWMSLDGGGFFEQIETLANSGYSKAYFSKRDQNLAVIVGPANAATGLIHLLSPEQGV